GGRRRAVPPLRVRRPRARGAGSRRVTRARAAPTAARYPRRVPPLPVRPRFRGVSHTYAFFSALSAGALLVAVAATPRAALARGIYACSLAALFGTSA